MALNLYLIVLIQAALTAGVAYLVARFVVSLKISLPVLSFFGAAILLVGLWAHLLPEVMGSLAAFDFSMALMMGVGGYLAISLLLPLLHRGAHALGDIVGLQIGDAVCNLTDALLIAAAALADPMLGIYVACVVTLHELPMEIVDVNVLVGQGLSAERAGLINLGTSLATALIGASLVLLVGKSTVVAVPMLLAGSLGMLSCLAVAILVKSARQLAPFSFVQKTEI